MTREETIAYGNDYYRDLISACCEIDEKHKEFVRMAIEALKAEPCEDAVSREAFKQKYKEEAHEEGLPEVDEDWLAIRVIDALPSVTPKQDWIPVSERLPEKDGEYLTTMKFIGYVTGTIYINIEETFFDAGKGFNVGVNEEVTAWMPLPEAYKGEGEKHE